MRRGQEEIERLREQVEQWRVTRRYRCAMPEQLWQQAVELSKRHGSHEVSKACNLNSVNLNKRLKKRGQKRVQRAKEQGFGFVEVEGIGLGGMKASAAVTVEMIDERGARLRVEYLSSDEFEVSQVVQLFWRRGR
jgi:hypothetical protein